MWETFRKQLSAQRCSLIWEMLLTLAAGMAGIALMNGILYFGKETESYFAMGTLIAAMIAGMYSLIMMIFQMKLSFNQQIAMGSTRRGFFCSYLLVNIAGNLAALLLLLLICRVENAMYAAWYPELENEISFWPYLWRGGLAVAVALPLACSLCGALLIRYGRIAAWSFWALWMVLCIGVPRVLEASEEAPGSLLGRLGIRIREMAGSLSPGLWAAVLTGAVLVCLTGSWMIFRKQQVTE